MFGIGTPEIIGIVLITLLVYGPDKLPEMIKKIVGFWRQIKTMSDEVSTTVSREIHKIERDVNIQEAKNLIEQNKNILSDTTKEIHESLNKPIKETSNDDEPTK